MTPIGSRAASRDSIRGVMVLWSFMPRNYSDFSDYEDSSDSHSLQPPCNLERLSAQKKKETARGQIVKAEPRQ